MCVEIRTRRRYGKNRLGMAAVLGAALWAIAACTWDKEYDSPYLPGSDEYAGDDWTHDGDGDGIADSVEKYSPGCTLAPRACLEQALAMKETPPGKTGLRAEDLLLWTGDAPKAPTLVWTPAEAAWQGYSLSSDDSAVVAVRGGELLPREPGETRIAVFSQGPLPLRTEFRVRVLARGVRLDSVRVADLELIQGASAPPAVEWFPPEATLKEFSLAVGTDSIVRAEGGSITALKPGRTSVVLTARDGNRTARFAVTVIAPDTPASLTARPLQLVAGDPPSLPLLVWIPPQAALAGYRLTLDDTTSAISITSDSRKLVPLRPGSANVTAVSADGSLSAGFTVTVTAPRVEVTGLAAGDMEIGLEAGPQAPLLRWEPADATNREYALSSGDSSVAIPFDGSIKPVGPGKAVFIAIAADGGFIAQFSVTVVERPDTVSSISAEPMSLPVGHSRAPVVTWQPIGAERPAYSVSIEDTAVAAVKILDGGVWIVGKTPGVTRGTVRLGNGLAAEFPITVTAVAVPLESIRVPGFSMDLLDGPRLPAITFVPADATDKSYSLEAPEPAGAIRIEAGKVVPVRPGKAPLRVVPAAAPSAAAVCTVTVTAKVRSVAAVNDSLVPGGPFKPAAAGLTWYPPEATDKSFRLTSLNPDTVAIDPAGVSYRGLTAGKARVVVEALDGSGAADTFTVLVRIPMTQIIAKDLTMRVGDPVLNPWFLFTFVPSNATNQGWSFLYPDPDAVPPAQSVVSIVENWKLQAVAPGTAKLIAYSLDNKAIRDTFTVTVVRPVSSIGVDTSEPIVLRAGYPDFSPAVTVLPSDASVKSWHLQSSNPRAATVVSGTHIHAVYPGTALITVISDDNPRITAVFAVEIR